MWLCEWNWLILLIHNWSTWWKREHDYRCFDFFFLISHQSEHDIYYSASSMRMYMINLLHMYSHVITWYPWRWSFFLFWLAFHLLLGCLQQWPSSNCEDIGVPPGWCTNWSHPWCRSNQSIKRFSWRDIKTWYFHEVHH